MTVLHHLKSKATDVSNAYMMTPDKEKIWTTLGPKFEDSQSIIQDEEHQSIF